MRLVAGAALMLGGASLALLSAVTLVFGGQAANVRITQLQCDTDPEVVVITNSGGTAQNLTGWHLRSDPVSNAQQVFDLGQVGTLDPAEQATIYSGGSAPATNAAADVWRWALSFKFRNSDPTDFAQIVDGAAQVIDQLNCGSQPASPTPTSTTAPATNTPPASTPTNTPPTASTPTNTPAASSTPTNTVPLTATRTPMLVTPTPNGQRGDVNCDGRVNAIDAALVLQLDAGMVNSLPCQQNADVNTDGRRNAIDALIILQFDAGLIGTLGPVATATPVAMACGTERWSVKTLSDPDAGLVNFTPVAETVADLRAIPAPPSLPDASRIAPTELTMYTVTARLVEFKREDDRDIHLVIADMDDPSQTMIVEFPDASVCSGAVDSAHADEMRTARAALVAAIGEPSSSFTNLTGTGTVTGVGFFDFLHRQTGVAPNGIELHPVLAFSAS